MIGVGIIAIIALLVGLEAQAWKGRTGAVYAFATFGLAMVGYLALYGVYIATETPEQAESIGSAASVALGLGVGAPVGLVCAIVVATLPNLKKRRQNQS